MADYDIVIIGGGLGGLTSGSLLAKQGLRVCVLEKNKRFGGYAVNYSSHGHRFDVATQALGGCGEGGIVQAILAELDLLGQVTFLPCEPARLYHFPDDDTPFIQHGFLDDQRTVLQESYPDFKSEIQTCFTVFADIFNELQTISQSSKNAIFGFSKNFPTLARYSRTTVHGFFDDLGLPHGLQLRLGARSGYCMLPLDKLSLVAFACTEMSYAGGAWMVEGGVGRLVDLLVSFLKEHNGHLIKSRVRQLIFTDGAISGVETLQGKKITAKTVILASDGLDIFQQSGDPCDQLLGKYKRLERTGSYLVSYYQVPSQCIKDMQANIEVRLAEQILAGKSKIEVYYLLIPSLVDKGSSPDGFHSFCISVPLAHQEMPDHNERLLIRQKLEQLVGDQYQSLRGHLKFLFELGPDHFGAMTGNTGGSAYGFAQTVTQSGIYRLGNNPKVKGLYLAGHWTMPGGGIAGVMTSGRLCASAVLMA